MPEMIESLSDLRPLFEQPGQDGDWWRAIMPYIASQVSGWNPIWVPAQHLNPTHESQLALNALYTSRFNLYLSDMEKLTQADEWVTSQVNHALRNLELICSPNPEEEKIIMAPTATKPGKSQRPNPNKAVAETTKAQPAMKPIYTQRGVMLHVAMLGTSPWQTRRQPSKEWLEELGQSLLQDEQTTNLLIRRMPDTSLQIISGHTRSQAARQVGIEQLRCDIVECDDVTAERLVLIDNTKRRDLSHIEKGIALQRLVESYAAAGKSQRQLADDIGISQGQISNLTRLLRLPEEFQDALISGEITLEMARELVPWCEYPAVSQELLQSYNEAKSDDDLADWLEDLPRTIDEALGDVSRPMTGSHYDGKRSLRRLFKWTAGADEELDKQLQLVTGPKCSKWSDPEIYALNREFWDKLNSEAEAKAAAKVQKGIEGITGKAKDKAAPPTAAELKQRAKQQAEQLAARIARWKVAIQRDMVRDWILKTASERELVALTMWLALHSQQWSEITKIREAFAGALKDCKRTSKAESDKHKLVAALLETARHDAAGGEHSMVLVLRETLSRLLVTCDMKPDRVSDPYIIEAAFNHAGLTIETIWASAYGEDIQEFFGLHSTAQLGELSRELKISGMGSKKQQMIDHLLETCWDKPCPRSIVAAKAKDASGKW